MSALRGIEILLLFTWLVLVVGRSRYSFRGASVRDLVLLTWSVMTILTTAGRWWALVMSALTGAMTQMIALEMAEYAGKQRPAKERTDR